MIESTGLGRPLGYKRVRVKDKKTVLGRIGFRSGMWQSKVTWVSKEAVYAEAEHCMTEGIYIFRDI